MLTTGRPLARARHACPEARTHVRSLLAPPTSSLPHGPARAPLSCETFRWEPATRRLVWSFAAMPMSCQRVAHQHGSGPLPAFPRASAGTGIVRRLSGPTAATVRVSTAPALLRSPRRRGGLPGPCFNTGPRPRRLLYFRFSSPTGLFRVPSRYFFAIGPALYLALGASATRSRCTTKQRYSYPARARGYHPLRRRIPAALSRAPQRVSAYHWGCSLFARRYYGNPCLFLLLPLMICLSPGRTRARCARFGTRPLPAAFRVHARPSSPGEPIGPVQEPAHAVRGLNRRVATSDARARHTPCAH